MILKISVASVVSREIILYVVSKVSQVSLVTGEIIIFMQPLKSVWSA